MYSQKDEQRLIPPPRPYPSIKDRILANCEITPGPLETPCWVWKGKLAGPKEHRQGSINVRIKRGKNKGKVRSKAVHRVSYEVFAEKKIKRHSITRHICNNTLCCNWEHMIANSTSRANNRDTVKAGRHGNQHRKLKNSM